MNTEETTESGTSQVISSEAKVIRARARIANRYYDKSEVTEAVLDGLEIDLAGISDPKLDDLEIAYRAQQAFDVNVDQSFDGLLA